MATKSNYDWSMLQNEYNICKKKLDSKREGLKILVKQLEQAQIERDVNKNKVSQLQSEINGLKDVLGSFWHKSDKGDKIIFTESNDKKIKTLSNLLQFSRDENLHLQNDLSNIRHLYSETQKDNQLLRNTLSTHESQKKAGLVNQQGKEKLIVQLEESNAKIECLDQEVKMMHDQIKELEEERNTFCEKNTRLNTELNYILHNDDKRVVDIDAIVLENQYLKEVVKQYKEEKTMALGTAARYKEALKQRHSSNSNTTKSKPLAYLEPVPAPKKSSTYEGFFSKSTSSMTVTDLQRVNKALTERVAEKETALKHQRNTNRVLGIRVSELEKKLRTLEISGLWTHEQRIPRYDEDDGTTALCSPPLSPDTLILIAEQVDIYPKFTMSNTKNGNSIDDNKACVEASLQLDNLVQNGENSKEIHDTMNNFDGTKIDSDLSNDYILDNNHDNLYVSEVLNENKQTNTDNPYKSVSSNNSANTTPNNDNPYKSVSSNNSANTASNNNNLQTDTNGVELNTDGIDQTANINHNTKTKIDQEDNLNHAIKGNDTNNIDQTENLNHDFKAKIDKTNPTHDSKANDPESMIENSSASVEHVNESCDDQNNNLTTGDNSETNHLESDSSDNLKADRREILTKDEIDVVESSDIEQGES